MTSTTTESKGDLQLTELSKLAAAASGFSLIVSVLYDYCFLDAMGLSLAEVPTTIADHVRSAIIWAPVLLGAIVVGLGYAAFGAWTGIGQEPNAGGDRGSTSFYLMNKVMLWFILPGAIALSYLIDGTAFAFKCVAGLVLWYAVGPKLLNAVKRTSNIGWGVWIACYWIPAIVVFACVLGNTRGTEMRDGRGPAWLVVVKDEKAGRTMTTNGIRRFGESVLVVDEQRRVHIIPASEILSARAADHQPLAQRAVCHYFGLHCVPLSPRESQGANAASRTSHSSSAPLPASGASKGNPAASSTGSNTAVPP